MSGQTQPKLVAQNGTISEPFGSLVEFGPYRTVNALTLSYYNNTMTLAIAVNNEHGEFK